MTESSPPPPADFPPGGRLIALVVAGGLFMETLDSTVINTAVPAIAHGLGEAPLRLNLAITAYLISLVVFIPISGWVADRFGARTVFCAATAVFMLGSLLCGLAESLPVLVASRVLQGLGGALMTPVGRLILLRSFPKTALVRAMALVTVPALIGPAIGPVVGGFFATYMSWRYIFFINLPIGLISILLAARTIENFRAEVRAGFDFPGFLLCGAGLALLQFGLEYGTRHMISPMLALAITGLAVACLLGFGFHVTRAANPVIDLRLFRQRTFSISVLAGGLSRLGQGGLVFLIPLTLQLGLGMSGFQSGLYTFMLAAGSIALKGVSAWALRWLGFRNSLVGNSLVQAVLIAGMALVGPGIPGWEIGLYLLVLGFFRSLHFTSINVLAFADIEPKLMSAASSVSAVGLQLSMSFGVTYAAVFLAWYAGGEAHLPLAAFRAAFVLLAATLLAAVPFFMRLHPDDGAAVSGHGVG